MNKCLIYLINMHTPLLQILIYTCSYLDKALILDEIITTYMLPIKFTGKHESLAVVLLVPLLSIL